MKLARLATAAVLGLRVSPVRPWLAASVAGDLTDVISTTAGRRRLPRGSTPATLAFGGGAALVSVVVAATVER